MKAREAREGDGCNLTGTPYEEHFFHSNQAADCLRQSLKGTGHGKGTSYSSQM